MSTPRGIRNNNPGNIRKSSAVWIGKIAGDDPVFEAFDTPVHGIRAVAKLLLNYERKYGLNTVHGLIDRWAPPVENDTSAYVRFVAGSLSVEPDAVIDVLTRLPDLVAAIITQENGQQPYTTDVIAEGCTLALEGTSDASQAPAVATAPAQPEASVVPDVGLRDTSGDGGSVGRSVGTSVSSPRAVTISGVRLSKKLVVAILGMLAILLNGPLNLGLTPADIHNFVALLASYIMSQAGIDVFAPVLSKLLKGSSHA